MPTSGNLGTLSTLLTMFAAAVMEVLVAFHLFSFDPGQRAAIFGLLSAAVILGGFLYGILHTWKVVTLAKATAEIAPMASLRAVTAPGAEAAPASSGSADVAELRHILGL